MLDQVVQAHHVRAAKPEAPRLGGLDALDLLVQGADDPNEVLEALSGHAGPRFLAWQMLTNQHYTGTGKVRGHITR